MQRTKLQILAFEEGIKVGNKILDIPINQIDPKLVSITLELCHTIKSLYKKLEKHNVPKSCCGQIIHSNDDGRYVCPLCGNRFLHCPECFSSVIVSPAVVAGRCVDCCTLFNTMTLQVISLPEIEAEEADYDCPT